MHLSRISTSIALDLSSPSIALVFSRFLLSLEAHIIDLRENVKNIASMVIDETYSQSAISWRTDRRVYNESTSESRDAHDMITRWVERQQYISAGECVLVYPYHYSTHTLTVTYPHLTR